MPNANCTSHKHKYTHTHTACWFVVVRTQIQRIRTNKSLHSLLSSARLLSVVRSSSITSKIEESCWQSRQRRWGREEWKGGREEGRKEGKERDTVREKERERSGREVGERGREVGREG